MSLKIHYSQIIDRPLAVVFRFFAIDHIQNHPRWDSDIELEPTSDEPIGVGTIIRRRNKRGGTIVEGTMEVTEFKNNESMTVLIREGGMEMVGRVDFEAVGDTSTRITQTIDLPGADKSMDTSLIVRRLNEAGEIRKRLIESEL